MTQKLLSHLIEQFHQGTPGAAEVLRDWYLEQGVDAETAINCINALSVGTPGPAPVGVSIYEIRPSTVFDTVRIAPAGHSTVRLFYMLAGGGFGELGQRYKTEADCNLNMPQRIDSYSAFRVMRISLTCLSGVVSSTALLTIKVNQHTLLAMSATDLAARGIWGVPALYDIVDRDDIRGNIQTFASDIDESTVRVTLHGWLKSRIY